MIELTDFEYAIGEMCWPCCDLPGMLDTDKNGMIHDMIRAEAKKVLELSKKELGWHSVEESLPPYDEEVIVLTDFVGGKRHPGANKICFGHRPDPKGWYGKDLVTGKIEHFQPKTYDGWNTPGIHHWMFCPKLNDEEIKSVELWLKSMNEEEDK